MSGLFVPTREVASINTSPAKNSWRYGPLDAKLMSGRSSFVIKANLAWILREVDFTDEQ